MSFIRGDGLRKVYDPDGKAVEALHNVNFSIEKGEFVSILGPSGCGKSTLLMMCGGLEEISDGLLMVAGTPMTGPRRDTGVMFQDPTLLPWKTVMENVLFPARIARIPIEPVERRARALLQSVGLQSFEGHRPHQLSGGMRQRVSICRALINDPSILLMDEPFSALDAITRDQMNVLLLDLWQQQLARTALFITHSIREAVLLSDRILVMTKRPATIVENVVVPFSRPRSPELAEKVEFNQLCGRLRGMIEHNHVG
ncbi:MAG: transporter ATPase [Bradyrhizobium sp.]|jgi:NitT/TauT family transport system ATP-binding protein|nr:transporter ATPase [Bradyrhizobium sp.]MEA2867517.1 NitT/TauT family transport system ATP-binding protein [Bradyrhizobium sp.]